MRAPVAYLLIALMLACPYLCMGGECFPAGDVGEGVTRSTPAACCRSCCDQQLPQSDDQSPDPAHEGNSDCLCHGAIYESRAKSPGCGDHDLFACWVSTTGPQSADACILSPAAHHDHAPLSQHFPPLITARDLCALTCALLL
jgi:hypothetical protein